MRQLMMTERIGTTDHLCDRASNKHQRRRKLDLCSFTCIKNNNFKAKYDDDRTFKTTDVSSPMSLMYGCWTVGMAIKHGPRIQCLQIRFWLLRVHTVCCYCFTMLRWLKKVDRPQYPPPSPGLPDPNKEGTPEQAELCAAANAEIAQASPTRGLKRKRADYGRYTDEQRFKIAR